MKKTLLVPILLAAFLAACQGAAGPTSQAAPGIGAAGGAPAYTGENEAGKDAVAPDRQATTPGSVPVPALLEPGRQMILTANIAMRSRDAWAAADRAQAVATSLGGDVVGLSQSGTGEQRSANVTLRVPSARFNDALRQLREMSDVEVLSSAIEGRDVTEQFVDLEARLKAKQAEEARYIALLARAERIEDILRIDQALAQVRTEIERLTGQLNSIRNRTQFSTISVSVAPLAIVPGTQPGAYDPSKTVERALATLVALARVAVDLAIWLLVLGWIPLLVAAAVFAARARLRPARTA